MSGNHADHSICPISAALTMTGDRWTLLILKEISLGVHRFEEIQAQVGASPFLLSSRLKRMQADGIIERRSYSTRPPRFEYYVTEMGHGVDSILISYLAWGSLWRLGDASAEPAVRLIDTQTGQLVDVGSPTPFSHLRFGDGYIRLEMSAEYQDERAQRRAAFFSARRASTRRE